MSISAWIMSIVVAIILYGGLGWCIAIAARRSREEHTRDAESLAEADQD